MIGEAIKLVLIFIMALYAIFCVRERDAALDYASDLERYMLCKGMKVPDQKELEAVIGE